MPAFLLSFLPTCNKRRQGSTGVKREWSWMKKFRRKWRWKRGWKKDVPIVGLVLIMPSGEVSYQLQGMQKPERSFRERKKCT